MEFFVIATAHFLALVSPGPDFFLIAQASLRLPLRYALAICLGITVANAVYLSFAILGLEVIKEMTFLVDVLKYLGAGYLMYLGFLLLRAPRQSLEGNEGGNFLRAQHLGKQFLAGFLSGILNPKNAIFYLSLFTVIVSAETGLVTRCLYGLWMTTAVFTWDVLVATVLGRDQLQQFLGKGVLDLM